MDITPYIPVVVEATKFVFREASHWIEQARKKVNKPAVPKPEKAGVPRLTENEFSRISAQPENILAMINQENAAALEYEIRGLVEMIRAHRKNFIDYEKAEADYGVLTPSSVRRGLEHEAEAMIEKEERLRALLEQIYEKQLAG
jgi:hypothetical protein